jgi:hypothetical protein
MGTTRRQTARLWGRLLAHPRWSGVGALAGVASVIFGFILWPSGGDDRSIHNNDIGDCAVVASQDSSPSCRIVPRPRSFGAVRMTENPGGVYVVPEEAIKLGTPPRFPIDHSASHCEEWQGWLVEKDAAVVGPSFDLLLTAGKDDLVVLTSVEDVVLAKDAVPAKHSVLACDREGGMTTPFLIAVDTASRRTTVSKVGGRSQPMPPTTLTQARAGAISSAVSVMSEPGYVYTGYIEINAVVNGEDRSYSYGTEEDPVRWVDGATFATDSGIDWNPKSHAWESVY